MGFETGWLERAAPTRLIDVGYFTNQHTSLLILTQQAFVCTTAWLWNEARPRREHPKGSNQSASDGLTELCAKRASVFSSKESWEDSWASHLWCSDKVFG